MPVFLMAFASWAGKALVTYWLVKLAGAIVFVGVSQTVISWMVDQVFSALSAYQGFALLQMAGIGDAIGIMVGAATFVALMRPIRVRFAA